MLGMVAEHQIHEHYIGMATALDDSLVVPVIQDADRMFSRPWSALELWLIKLEFCSI